MTGKELKLLRKGKKLQAQTFAKLLGISGPTLYRHEQSDEVPLLVENAARYILGIVIVDNVIVTQKKVVNANLRSAKKMEMEEVRPAAKAVVSAPRGRLSKKEAPVFVPSFDDSSPLGYD